ncbi:hypothetical protein SDC9_100619 [bioreactor metagenome]|uniref:Uncharacterized protein n=1 Tax=bioreactor metagenome TaxID=1076179 RepID=A0A645AL24_9ZZZZ
MPIGISLSVFMILEDNDLFINRVISILIIIGFLTQLIYNYLKWKKMKLIMIE